MTASAPNADDGDGPRLSVDADEAHASALAHGGERGPPGLGTSSRRDEGQASETGEGTEVDMIYFLLWSSFYQLATASVFFWVDIIPWYGFSHGISGFRSMFSGGWRCTVLQAHGCEDGTALVRMLVFVGGYSLSYVATAGLLRYSHGATWAALTATLVTPVGALFWTLFNESPFQLQPHATLTTWTSLAGLCVMLPAVYFFHTFAHQEEHGEQEHIPEELVALEGAIEGALGIQHGGAKASKARQRQDEAKMAGSRALEAPLLAGS